MSLEGMMLKLKLQYFGHLMRRVDSLGGIGEFGKPQSETEMFVLSQFLDRRIWEVERASNLKLASPDSRSDSLQCNLCCCGQTPLAL